MSVRKFNISSQTCNYCKEKGHRIHAMDENGVYLADENGERILSCPVILAKNMRMKKVEMEFPPLTGSAPATEWTIKISRAILASVKEQKQKRQADRKALVEAKRRTWAERHVEKMKVKYGPLWYKQVTDTPEDSLIACELRFSEEEQERIRDEEEYYRDREQEEKWNKEWEQENNEKEERRSKMTPEERMQDEWDEEEEIDNDMWRMSCERERLENCERKKRMEEKKVYEENGWPWPPKK